MFLKNQKKSNVIAVVSVLRSILSCEKSPHKPIHPPKSVEEDWNEVIKIPTDKIDKDKILEIFKKRGIEAIAWYAPFHYFEAEDWGIYYNFNVIRCLSEEIFGTVNLENIYKIINSVRYHEIFHFLIEMAISRLELMITWFNKSNIYKLRNTIEEEVLATIYQYLNTQNKDEIEYIFSNLPYPYSLFRNESQNFESKLEDLFQGILNVQALQDFKNIYLVSILKNPSFLSLDNFFSEILFKESSFLIPLENVPERIII